MPRNIEKINAGQTFGRADIEQGLLDYQEIEQQKQIDSLPARAEKIIDSFSEEDVDGYTEIIDDLETKIDNLPARLKIAVFDKWLEQEPEKALYYIAAFGSLPASFQGKIVKALSNESVYQYINNSASLPQILQVFKKISNHKLHDLITRGNVRFSDIAPYLSRLPYLSEQQALEYARQQSLSGGDEYDWANIIPHIQNFPSIRGQDAVIGAFTQSVNARPEVVIKHRKQLQLATRDMIDLFVKHNRDYLLIRHLPLIEPEFHHEIVFKALKTSNWPELLDYANEIRPVECAAVWAELEKMAKVKNGKNVLQNIANRLYGFNQEWLSQAPISLLKSLLRVDPQAVLNCAMPYLRTADIDKQELVQVFIKKGQFQALIDRAEFLKLKIDAGLVAKILDYGGRMTFLNNLEKFPIMPAAIFRQLFEEDGGFINLSIIDRFQGLKKYDFYLALQRTTKGIRHPIIQRIIDQPEQIAGLEFNQEFVQVLIETGHYMTLIYNIDKFHNIDFSYICHQAIKDGFLNELLDVFPGVLDKHDIDPLWLAEQAIQAGFGHTVIERYDYFIDSADERKIIRKFIEYGLAPAVAEHSEMFDSLKIDRELGQEVWAGCVAGEWRAVILNKLNQLYQPRLDKNFALAYELLGDELSLASYRIIGDIQERKIDPEQIKDLGITQIGAAGINQLRQVLARFKAEMVEPEFDCFQQRDNPILRDYFKSYVRFTESQWGGHDESEFFEIINRFHELKQAGHLRPLPEGYDPSPVIRVKKVDQEAQRKYQYSEQFLNRYAVLKESLTAALKLLEQKKPLKLLALRAEVNREAVLAELKSKMESPANPKARENLAKRIQELQAVDLNNIKDFQTNFQVLAQFGEFHEDLRQLMILMALNDHENYQAPAREAVQRDAPKFDDIGWMINFIEHIVNEETWKKYFTDDHAAKTFRKLINVNALNEEYSRAQNQEAAGAMKLKFTPARGLLLELSGHIADACWASKYNCIAEAFPNFVAVIMAQNPGSKHERLAGAGLLIETQAVDGTRLLVIRGLNPIENVINSLSVEDFFQQYIEYAKKLAQNTGRRLAIVIDDHSGGAATNRPVLFDYLSRQQANLKQIRLQSWDDTTFNGYDIFDDTYLVD